VPSQALPGWRIKRGNAEFKVFFGRISEALPERSIPTGCANRKFGARGLRLAHSQ
jgi:hypothetical protein